MTTTAMDLLDSIRAHLVEFELPDLWSVHVVTSFSGPNVDVQLDRRDSPGIAGGLLAWADTLTEVAVEACRVPNGKSVHLSVMGQLPNGVLVRVFGGVPFTGRGIGGDLAPDASKTVPLAVLREQATLGKVTV
jgi:hypothetical protein